MLQKGSARKVTIYINEDTQHHSGSLCDAILTFLLHKGVPGATATPAMAGFGAHHVLHTTKIEVLAQHLPIRIEFVESAERVDELMPTLYEMVTDGVIEVHDTEVVKFTNLDRPSPPGTHAKGRTAARMMRVYMGESDKWQGQPLYEAIVKQLHLMDIAGATVYRGILGYGAKGHTHRSGRFRVGHDLPVMISVIDSEDRLNKAIDEIEVMMQDGIIVLSEVDVVRLVQSSPAEAR